MLVFISWTSLSVASNPEFVESVMTYTKVLAFVAFRLSVLLIMATAAPVTNPDSSSCCLLLLLLQLWGLVFQSFEEIKSSETGIVLLITDISSYSLKETDSPFNAKIRKTLLLVCSIGAELAFRLTILIIESLPIHELNIFQIVVYEVAVARATVCSLDESKQNFRCLRYGLPHDVLPRTSPWVDRKLTCQLQPLHSLRCSFLTVDAGISISCSIFLPCQHGPVITRLWPVHILINSMSQGESERGNSGSPAEVEANVTPHVQKWVWAQCRHSRNTVQVT